MRIFAYLVALIAPALVCAYLFAAIIASGNSGNVSPGTTQAAERVFFLARVFHERSDASYAFFSYLFWTGASCAVVWIGFALRDAYSRRRPHDSG